MLGISKMREKIMKAQKGRRPSKANLNNSTMGLSQIEEKCESLLALPPLQAGEALRESEEKFYKAFCSSPDAIAITTLKDGKFIEVNDSFTRVNGYTREEVIGRSSAEIGNWASAEERDRVLRMLKEQGRVSYEEVHLRLKSGKEHVALFSAEPIEIDGEPCMISVAVDITERKRAEEALAASENDKKIILNAISDIVLFHQDSSLTIKWANEAAARSVGKSPQDLVGKHCYQLWHERNKPCDDCPVIRALETKSSVTGSMKTPDGRSWEVSGEPLHDSDGKMIGAIEIAHDITERKRAEEALANEAIWRRILIEQSGDGIVILDQNGKVYEANRRFAEMLGYSPEEALQLYVWDWDTQWTKEQLLDMIHSVSAAGDHFETYHRRKDGTIYDVEISTNGATFAGQKLVFCVCRDVTERKRAEEALREAEEKFSKAFSSSPNMVAISTLEDGRFIEVNDSYTRINGYTREEVVGRSSIELGAWAEPGERDRILRTLKEQGRVYNEEVHLCTKSGEVRTCLFSVEPITIGGEPCMISEATDITQRKQAEEALRESEEFSTSLLGNAPNPITVVNPDTSIKYVNPAFEKLTGFSLAEIAGTKAPYPWWLEERKEERLNGLQEFMAGGSAITEQTIQNKNGERFRIELNMVRVMHNGEFKYYLAHWKDITELKQAEAALKESEEKYRDLLDNTYELIQSVTPDGRFRYVNNGWKQALGYSEEEIANLSVFDIIHPDCLEHYRMLFQKMKAGEDVGLIKATFVSKDGSKILVEGNVTCKFADGELVYTRSVFRDVTKSKYLEEQMFRLSSAVSMSTDCIVITDFDAKIIDVNLKTLEMYGAESKEELLGRHFLELIVPAERVAANMDVGEIIEKGYLECREYNMISKQGQVFPVQMSTSLVRNADGEPMGMVRVGREISKLN